MQIRRLRPARQDNPDALEHVLDRSGKLLGNRRRADPVFKDQRKADDPREELAHRRIRVCVCAPRDRHHRAKLGVAERGEERCEPGEEIRNDHGRTGSDDPGADGGEDAAADHRTQANCDEVFRGQRPLENPLSCKRAKFVDVGRRKEFGDEGHFAQVRREGPPVPPGDISTRPAYRRNCRLK